MNSEIRKDYLEDRYAIIAPKRAKRFRNTVGCPFCPENASKKQIIVPFSQTNHVAVYKNLFPAFTEANPKAYGHQEIVIDSPVHDKHFHELSVAEIAAVLKAFADRVTVIKKNKKIKHVEVMKNYGEAAGASIAHGHSQIIGLGFVPRHLEHKTEKEHAYQAKTGRCPYCDIIKKEIKTARKIFADKNIFVFAPYASQFAYEARIFTRRHVDNVSLLNDAERASLALALKNLTTSITGLNIAYNFYTHERVGDTDQHFYLKLTPRGAYWAGVELGTGLIINSIPPEDAAKFYRAGFKQ